MKKANAVLFTLMMLTVPLAGCTGDDGPAEVLGCTNTQANNYNENVTKDDGTCDFDLDDDGVQDSYEVDGCTDDTANNLDLGATDDDGSCDYDLDDDGVLDADEILGCMDSTANNYNLDATDEDGSCDYDLDDDGVLDADEILGCTDSTANNYNSEATDENDSCDYDLDDDGVLDADEILGCMDSNANNLDLGATDADDSCDYDLDDDGVLDSDEVLGCRDLIANNYNSEATDEDGSCDYDLGDDGVGDNAYLDGNSSNYCGENSVKTYLDSEGCTKIFRIESETFKKYSSITRVDSVSRGLNPTSQMVITPNGKVLAVLDDKSLLTLHFLDEKTSESSILSEEDSLAILHDNGRIVIISGSECIDALLKTPCLMGWKNSLTSPGNEHYWSGHVYFSEEYTPCKPGWSGLSHCHSGWFRIGDWNEFLSPSIMGIVSASPSLPPTPCPGCASPNGLYIADVAQIVTDWELIGGMDIKMDIVVSQTETWMSGDGEISRPGGLATVVGGYNFGSCGSIVCLISEMGDGVMFDFGGFTWSGDSSYLYAATSDSIVTIDMADKSYWEMDNRLSCDSSNSPPHFTGVSTPDGSRVIVPCGTSLIILDVDRNGDGDKDFPWFRVCCLLLITVGLIAYFVGNSESNQASFSLLIVMLLIMSSFSGCISDASNLDKDSEKLPSSIDLTIQGGIEAGKLVVFVSPGEDVPPESVDILLESAGSHQWFQLGHRSIGQLTGYDLAETTSFNTERVCSDGCSQISVKAFYRGQLISQQDISI